MPKEISTAEQNRPAKIPTCTTGNINKQIRKN